MGTQCLCMDRKMLPDPPLRLIDDKGSYGVFLKSALAENLGEEEPDMIHQSQYTPKYSCQSQSGERRAVLLLRIMEETP